MAENITTNVNKNQPINEVDKNTGLNPFDKNNDDGSTTPRDTDITQNPEAENADDILVTIKSPVPVVVLFGARTSGKTMTLVRLTRFLENNGYTVTPDEIFRQSDSKYYKDMCKSFSANVNKQHAANATAAMNFMLLHVRKKGGGPMVCQILEAPGEHYFDVTIDPDNQNMTFLPYIERIIKDDHLKIWVFIVEVDWKDESTRLAYAKRIAKMRNKIKARDKIILMCHKADLKEDTHYHKGYPNKMEFYKTIKEQYPAVFDSNKNVSPLKRLFSPYDMDFVVFSAGSFHGPAGHQTYNEGEEHFPKNLWNTILKKVRGGWFS